MFISISSILDYFSDTRNCRNKINYSNLIKKGELAYKANKLNSFRYDSTLEYQIHGTVRPSFKSKTKLNKNFYDVKVGFISYLYHNSFYCEFKHSF